MSPITKNAGKALETRFIIAMNCVRRFSPGERRALKDTLFYDSFGGQ